MGYTRHHAIVVTTWHEKTAVAARSEAVRRFAPLEISPVLRSVSNGFFTFLVPPDGSNEGRNTSRDYAQRRADFVEWMESKQGDDESGGLDWALLYYGDDDDESEIEAHSGTYWEQEAARPEEEGD